MRIEYSRIFTHFFVFSTKGFKFGAYISDACESPSGYKANPNAFIFTLVNACSMPLLIPVKSGDKYSILCKAELGPTFGCGNDIMIWSDSNTSTESYSNLGSSLDFKLFNYGRVQAQSFLAGSRNFQTSEIKFLSF